MKDKILIWIKTKKSDEDLNWIIILFSSVVCVTIVLLIVVTLFELLEIHVAGSREMWIGLIGSLMGGAYTLLGVRMTTNYQRKNDKELQRLENLPLLKFDIEALSLDETAAIGIFTVWDNSVFSTAFPRDEYKRYPIINISLANNNPAFGVYIESCVTTMHEAELQKTECFFPEQYRLVSDEILPTMFWIKDYDEYPYANVLGVLRVEYYDIFGNKYFQDVPFSYNEHAKEEYMLEIFNLKPPVLVGKYTPTLFETMKSEYKYLFENDKSKS